MRSDPPEDLPDVVRRDLLYMYNISPLMSLHCKRYRIQARPQPLLTFLIISQYIHRIRGLQVLQSQLGSVEPPQGTAEQRCKSGGSARSMTTHRRWNLIIGARSSGKTLLHMHAVQPYLHPRSHALDATKLCNRNVHSAIMWHITSISQFLMPQSSIHIDILEDNIIAAPAAP